MISVAPNTLARRVLELVVESPGELDAEAIAVLALPAIPLELPPPKAGHAARSKAYSAWQDAEIGPLVVERGKQVRRGGRRDQATAKVSRILGRLQEQGFIETRGPPVIAPWWRPGADLDAAIRGAMDEETTRPNLASHIAMLSEVEKGPTSAADLLGSDPSGARKRVYADLVTWGILIPPSYRWPTAKGAALLRDPEHSEVPTLAMSQ